MTKDIAGVDIAGVDNDGGYCRCRHCRSGHWTMTEYYIFRIVFLCVCNFFHVTYATKCLNE